LPYAVRRIARLTSQIAGAAAFQSRRKGAPYALGESPADEPGRSANIPEPAAVISALVDRRDLSPAQLVPPRQEPIRRRLVVPVQRERRIALPDGNDRYAIVVRFMRGGTSASQTCGPEARLLLTGTPLAAERFDPREPSKGPAHGRGAMNRYAVGSNLMLFVSLAMLLASAAPIVFGRVSHAPRIGQPVPFQASTPHR